MGYLEKFEKFISNPAVKAASIIKPPVARIALSYHLRESEGLGLKPLHAIHPTAASIANTLTSHIAI